MPGAGKSKIKRRMRILIVAGGTGGHLYPAVALVDYLKSKDHSVMWIGGERELERKIIEKKKVKFHKITARPFPRSISPYRWIEFLLFSSFSLIQSFRYIRSFKPDVVVGMGSYHSFPVVIAAFIFGIPSVICEQNILPSLTNRMLLPFASRITLSFPHTRDYLPQRKRKKAVVTGNPVRENITATSKKIAIEKLGLDEKKFTLLFSGGSQGAHYLNKVAVETLKLLESGNDEKNIQFIIITGEKDFSWVCKKLKLKKIKGKIFSFLSEINYAYAAADLVISRSGATTLAEITACGLPCILIPYPFATNQHQLSNALFLEKEGGAKVIPESKLNAHILKKTIEEIIHNPLLMEKMRRASKKWGKLEATKNLADLILQVGKG